MTWKRELAFWSFMFLVAMFFMFGVVATGKWLSENWGARVSVEARG